MFYLMFTINALPLEQVNMFIEDESIRLNYFSCSFILYLRYFKFSIERFIIHTVCPYLQLRFLRQIQMVLFYYENCR